MNEVGLFIPETGVALTGPGKLSGMKTLGLHCLRNQIARLYVSITCKIHIKLNGKRVYLLLSCTHNCNEICEILMCLNCSLSPFVIPTVHTNNFAKNSEMKEEK